MKTTDEMILTAVLAHPTNEAAAKSLKMSTSQLYTRMSAKSYQTLQKDVIASSLEHTTGILRENLSSAINVIKSIAENEENPVSVRLAAANSIIKNFGELATKAAIARTSSTQAHDPLDVDNWF